MKRYIIKIEDKYFEYSDDIKAIITIPMSLEQFKVYYNQEYKDHQVKKFEEYLIRAKHNGANSYSVIRHNGTNNCGIINVKKLLSKNKAGKNETNLSFEQILSWVRGEVLDPSELVGL